MPEEILFASERSRTRTEIAAYLRTVADALEAGDPVTLSAGEQSVTMEPPANPTFEVKAEREGPTDAPGELSVEFEIEWDEADGDGGDLTIE
jgi:amphi-Trp domain-containing protein